MGKKWKQWETLFSWALKSLWVVTVAMKLRCLLLGRKTMTNLDSLLKSKDITLPTKVCIVKAMVFPVVMYGCENWTIKKAERQRIDAFELCCVRRFLRAPWTAMARLPSPKSENRCQLSISYWTSILTEGIALSNLTYVLPAVRTEAGRPGWVHTCVV